MILLESLIVTHNDLRDWSSIDHMVAFVEKGGRFTSQYLLEYAMENQIERVSPLIQIAKFEDGVMYVHDGHHRVVAIHLAGRTHLDAEEFQLTDWMYSQYLEVSNEHGWYTPFDPRTHVRLPDFAAFKRLAREKFSQKNESIEELNEWIQSSHSCYRTERRFKSVERLSLCGRDDYSTNEHFELKNEIH